MKPWSTACMLLLPVFLSAATLISAAPADVSLDHALAYLSREVPRWQRDNQCASCHNNGDAARALYVARRLRHHVPAASLASTSAWLAQPASWDSNRGNPAFSDKNLARIQFAAALLEALDAKVVKDRQVLRQAAESLLPEQK